VVRLLPSGALADGLRTALVTGQFPGWNPILVLLAWAVASAVMAARTVRLR
jgi:ABC-2 type transport system permease protein